jgi:hypothetical protein
MLQGDDQMNCPKCRIPTTKRGLLEKIRVLSGSKEKFEIDVVVVVCVKCQTILGVVNAPQT